MTYLVLDAISRTRSLGITLALLNDNVRLVSFVAALSADELPIYARLVLLQPASSQKHIKFDAGTHEGYEEERDDDQLSPEETANGTDFTEIQVFCALSP